MKYLSVKEFTQNLFVRDMKNVFGIFQVFKWASLIAQLVKNLPAMQETLV